MSTVSTVYDTGGSLAVMALDGKYAYISSYITSNSGNEGFIHTVNVDNPTITNRWLNTGTKFVMQMVVNGGYLYLALNDLTNEAYTIGRVYLDDSSPPTLVTFYSSAVLLFGVAVSDNYIYTTTLYTILSIDKETEVVKTAATSSSTANRLITGLVINGDYLYAGMNSGIARLGIGDDTTFTPKWWNGSPEVTYSVAADGDFIYVACKGENATNLNIKQISVADPTNYSWFDQTVTGIYSIFANNGYLYAPLLRSTVMFTPVVTDTFVYSPNEVSTTNTAHIRRPGKNKHVGTIELNTRTILGRFRRRDIFSSHNEFILTVFDKMSTISGRFTYVNRTGTLSEEVACNVLSASGPYARAARVSIKPKGSLMEVTVQYKRCPLCLQL